MFRNEATVIFSEFGDTHCDRSKILRYESRLFLIHAAPAILALVSMLITYSVIPHISQTDSGQILTSLIFNRSSN